MGKLIQQQRQIINTRTFKDINSCFHLQIKQQTNVSFGLYTCQVVFWLEEVLLLLLDVLVDKQ